jgi:chromate transporter
MVTLGWRMPNPPFPHSEPAAVPSAQTLGAQSPHDQRSNGQPSNGQPSDEGPSHDRPASAQPRGSVGEVALAFLQLGLTSFGGPIAHLGYFHREFVVRRRWLDEQQFGQLLGLCQFLPGPASSQLGFSLGLLRAGWAGALAAFVGFTLPSALLLFVFALFSDRLAGPLGQATLHGLKLLAVAVVAQGVLNMARTLAPDRPRAMVAATVAAGMAISGNAWMQLLVIGIGALLGPWLCPQLRAQPGQVLTLGYGRRVGGLLLLAFGLLLALALLAATGRAAWPAQVAAAFYRTGALVFGGGHVVLPLLKQAVVAPGWISESGFLSGYGAAQAVPGPMFSLAAFLGDRLFDGRGGLLGAVIGLAAIFLPGLLLVAGVLPFWRVLSARDRAARMLAGINAAVVGLLAAALYDPLWLGAVRDSADFAIAVLAFGLLLARWPALAVLAFCVLSAWLRTWWR